jgi:hypothetical protein
MNLLRFFYIAFVILIGSPAHAAFYMTAQEANVQINRSVAPELEALVISVWTKLYGKNPHLQSARHQPVTFINIASLTRSLKAICQASLRHSVHFPCQCV